MNGFLVGILNVLNQVLAVFIIVSGAIGGAQGRFEPWVGAVLPNAILDAPDRPAWWPVLGGLAGVVGGVILAGLVCGLVAALVTIAGELQVIRKRLAYPPLPPPRR